MPSDDEHAAKYVSSNPRRTFKMTPPILNPYRILNRPRNVAYPDSKGFQVPEDNEASVISASGSSVVFTVNGSHNETEYQLAKEKYLKRAREVKGWAIGPMPEEPFLQRFLPYNTDTPPSSPLNMPMNRGGAAKIYGRKRKRTKRNAYDSIKSPVKREKELYYPLVGISRYFNPHVN